MPGDQRSGNAGGRGILKGCRGRHRLAGCSGKAISISREPADPEIVAGGEKRAERFATTAMTGGMAIAERQFHTGCTIGDIKGFYRIRYRL